MQMHYQVLTDLAVLVCFVLVVTLGLHPGPGARTSQLGDKKQRQGMALGQQRLPQGQQQAGKCTQQRRWRT